MGTETGTQLGVPRAVQELLEPQARQRALGDDGPADFPRVCHIVIVGDHHADVVADQVDLAERGDLPVGGHPS
jgi:hypothetical protein